MLPQLKLNLNGSANLETRVSRRLKRVLWACAVVVLALGSLAAAQPPGAGTAGAPSDPGELAARISLAAEEYALGVTADARLVNRAEYDEARLFLDAVSRDVAAFRRTSPRTSPDSAWHDLAQAVDSARAVVERVGTPDEVQRWVGEALAILAGRLGAKLVEWPLRAPSLSSGRALYRAHCSACHGVEGRGDGSLAAGMDPPPTDFTDPDILSATPARLFHVVSHGIPGTAMSAWRERLSPTQRWDLAAYVRSLAGDSGSVTGFVASRGVDWGGIRGLLQSAVRRGLEGDSEGAAQEALAAYLEFEKVENVVRARRPGLAASLERDFLALREAVRGRPGEGAALARRLEMDLGRAQDALARAPGSLRGVAESLTIIVREGFEAILIVGALLALLVKSGHRARRRSVLWGVFAAVCASLLTAVAVEGIFRWSPASREALEGITMLLATVVLFSVSYWLVSKVEHAAWDRYIRGKVQSALAKGSDLALAGVAFLAVYREGFETVLFYRALLAAAPSPGAVVLGFAVGCVILAAIFALFYGLGVRIALRPFFAGTGAVLYYLAFVFAGRGIHELQEAGWLATTVVHGLPSLDWLGLYPTVEGLGVQALLILALAAAVLWVFVMKPMRLRATSPAHVSERGSS